MKILLFLLFTSLAQAGDIESFRCVKELKVQEAEWQPKGEWIQKEDGTFIKRIRFSEWVVAKEIPEGSSISKVTPKKTVEVTFTGPECKHEVQKDKEKLNKKYDHDKDIYKFIVKKKMGAIYIWSPDQKLSLKGIYEIKKAAEKLKLPLMIFLDKDVPDTQMPDLRKLVGARSTHRLNSIEMRMRLKEGQYPALLTFKNSKLQKEIRYGFEEASVYRDELTRMLELKKK